CAARPRRPRGGARRAREYRLRGAIRVNAPEGRVHLADLFIFDRARYARLLLASLIAALLACAAYSALEGWARGARPENAGLPFGVSWNAASQKYLLTDLATH